MQIAFRLLLPPALVLLGACEKQNASSSLVTESVLSDGMRITASTPNGELVITGKKGPMRIYSGPGWSKDSTLIPRQKRWYGSLGLYDPAGSETQSGRVIVDEGRQFFVSESEALRYMKYLSGYFGELTYSKRGLVVAYKVIPVEGGSPIRSIAVWQIYINGQRPTSFRGGDDSKIKIEGGSIPVTAIPSVAPVGMERELSLLEYQAPH